jgi:pyruvate ferredoxin oxidoreductase alpha subunit
VVVLDRNCSFGHHGVFYQETKSALYELPAEDRPSMRGIIAGLGGRDITPEDIEQMLLQALESPGLESVTWWNALPEEEAVEAGPCATTK